LQSLAPTNPHWARVVGYGPFSSWLIHKEGLCPSSGDVNRLMMMMNYTSIEEEKKKIGLGSDCYNIFIAIYSDSLLRKRVNSFNIIL
jgi:hypothetical protein